MEFMHVSELMAMTPRECIEHDLFQTEKRINELKLKINLFNKELSFFESNKKELELSLQKYTKKGE
mgnify:CR=1 FL=1